MICSKLVVAMAVLAPFSTAGAQWQVGASTGLNFFGAPRPLLQTSASDQLYIRSSVGMNATDLHISAFNAVSSRLDLGVEFGYASLAIGSVIYDRDNSKVLPSFDASSGAQLLTLAKARFRISDDDWRLGIGVTAGAGIISQSGFQATDPDADNRMTRPLGELGVALTYPLTNRFGLRLENSWLFYETASDRAGFTTSTKGLRDRRLSVGFDFKP